MKKYYRRNITKEELRKYEPIKFLGNIHYIDTPKSADIAVKELNKFNLLGFDTEDVPYKVDDPKKKLALIQLCNDNDCYLFAVQKCGLTDALLSLLSDEKILKIGVATAGDIKGIQRVKYFTPAGFVDLQKLVKDYNIDALSLSKISAVVLGQRVSKRQQRSNWGRSQLTEAQKIYAATDAWAALMIYKKLTGK